MVFRPVGGRAASITIGYHAKIVDLASGGSGRPPRARENSIMVSENVNLRENKGQIIRELFFINIIIK